jgi:hypothetical protein
MPGPLRQAFAKLPAYNDLQVATLAEVAFQARSHRVGYRSLQDYEM